MSFNTAVRERGHELIKRLRGIENAKYVEIGVNQGHHSDYVLSHLPTATAYLVDNWLAKDEQPERYKETGDTNAQQPRTMVQQRKQQAYQRLSKYGKQAQIINMDSVAAAKRMPMVHLVFIDGDHSEEGCYNDIVAYWPTVKPGGWLGGHDYANNDPRFNFGVTEAVTRWAKQNNMRVELGRNFTWWVKKPLRYA